MHFTLFTFFQFVIHVYPSVPKPHAPLIFGMASALPAFSFRDMAADLLTPSRPVNFGSPKEGVYIQVGLGSGFYVPQGAYDDCKRIANETRKVQFLTVTKDGEAIHGTREECQAKGDGGIAWIVPE